MDVVGALLEVDTLAVLVQLVDFEELLGFCTLVDVHGLLEVLRVELFSVVGNFVEDAIGLHLPNPF